MIPGLSIPITIDLQRLYGQKINLVQGENAGRRLAFTIVSGGVAVNLTGKILLLTGTKSDGSPVCLPITISSATTGQAYCDIVSGLVSAVGDATLQIRILTPALTGTATSGTTTSMYDTSKTWTVNGYVGSWLYIKSGTRINPARRISSNTATQLVVSDAWGTNPAAGSGYSIVTETGFSFPFTANVAASPNADAGIVQTGDFSALTAAIATAYGFEPRLAALEAATAWIDAAKLGTWTGHIWYKKVGNRVYVSLDALVNANAVGTQATTLPAGYRPGKEYIDNFLGQTTSAPCRSVVTTTGDIYIQSPTGGPSAAGESYSQYLEYLAEG